jgi:NCS1 family nucleobase:cation symporter-1
MGIMVADFYLVRRTKIKLSDLYKADGCYSYYHGINWRAVPAWVVGWAPTIGGLILNAKADTTGPRVLYELFYVSFFYGASFKCICFPMLTVEI